jgi:hypothetical protein
VYGRTTVAGNRCESRDQESGGRALSWLCGFAGGEGACELTRRRGRVGLLTRNRAKSREERVDGGRGRERGSEDDDGTDKVKARGALCGIPRARDEGGRGRKGTTEMPPRMTLHHLEAGGAVLSVVTCIIPLCSPASRCRPEMVSDCDERCSSLLF